MITIQKEEVIKVLEELGTVLKDEAWNPVNGHVLFGDGWLGVHTNALDMQIPFKGLSFLNNKACNLKNLKSLLTSCPSKTVHFDLGKEDSGILVYSKSKKMLAQFKTVEHKTKKLSWDKAQAMSFDGLFISLSYVLPFVGEDYSRKALTCVSINKKKVYAGNGPVLSVCWNEDNAAIVNKSILLEGELCQRLHKLNEVDGGSEGYVTESSMMIRTKEKGLISCSGIVLEYPDISGLTEVSSNAQCLLDGSFSKWEKACERMKSFVFILNDQIQIKFHKKEITFMLDTDVGKYSDTIENTIEVKTPMTLTTSITTFNLIIGALTGGKLYACSKQQKLTIKHASKITVAACVIQ